MATFRLEQDKSFKINSIFLNDQINLLIDRFIPIFNRTIKFYVYTSLFFFLSIMAEICCLVAFIPFLIKSSLLAFSLALIFLTLFSYFIIRLYLKTTKPAQFQDVKEQFIESFKKTVQYRADIPEHHLVLANACIKLSSALQGKEHSYYKKLFSGWFKFADPVMEKFSLFWHWQDVLDMRELLLQHAIEEYVELVRFAPTDLELHATLANAYVTLSTLYSKPQFSERGEDSLWQPSESHLELLEKKFRLTANKAIEEFKILSNYAPDDPWVHEQLAYSYNDLGMPNEEIKAYETVLALCPNDKEALYKLGVLYFQQGHNALGLQVYEKLKNANYKKAESLMSHYGI